MLRSARGHALSRGCPRAAAATSEPGEHVAGSRKAGDGRSVCEARTSASRRPPVSETRLGGRTSRPSFSEGPRPPVGPLRATRANVLTIKTPRRCRTPLRAAASWDDTPPVGRLWFGRWDPGPPHGAVGAKTCHEVGGCTKAPCVETPPRCSLPARCPAARRSTPAAHSWSTPPRVAFRGARMRTPERPFGRPARLSTRSTRGRARATNRQHLGCTRPTRQRVPAAQPGGRRS